MKTSCIVTIQSSDYQCQLCCQNSLNYLLLFNRVAHMKFVTQCSHHYGVLSHVNRPFTTGLTLCLLVNLTHSFTHCLTAELLCVFMRLNMDL